MLGWLCFNLTSARSFVQVVHAYNFINSNPFLRHSFCISGRYCLYLYVSRNTMSVRLAWKLIFRFKFTLLILEWQWLRCISHWRVKITRKVVAVSARTFQQKYVRLYTHTFYCTSFYSHLNVNRMVHCCAHWTQRCTIVDKIKSVNIFYLMITIYSRKDEDSTSDREIEYFLFCTT